MKHINPYNAIGNTTEYLFFTKPDLHLMGKSTPTSFTNVTNVNPQLKNYFNDDNYLLADKLISYLTGNAITSMSEYYDIAKVQDYFLTNKKPYVSPLDKSNTLYDEASFVASGNKELQKLYNDVLGSWSEADTEAVKQTMLNYIFDKYTDKNLSLNFCPTYFDRLPYVDNDIEMLMHKHLTVYEEKQLTGEANG